MRQLPYSQNKISVRSPKPASSKLSDAFRLLQRRLRLRQAARDLAQKRAGCPLSCLGDQLKFSRIYGEMPILGIAFCGPISHPASMPVPIHQEMRQTADRQL
jgi:hypothetical protein